MSTYHAHHKLMAGDEQPTYYWRRAKTAPWHIDFCLIPEEWVPNLQEVRVGTFED